MTAKKANLPASVRARLLALARARGEDYNLMLQKYAIEGLLRRLAVSKHRDAFVLKGARLYTVWGYPTYRPSRDVDFLGHGDADPAAVAERIREICSVEVEDDGLRFLPATITAAPIREEAEYGGVRVHVEATLEPAKIRVQIDVGFGDAVSPGPQTVDYPVLLDASVPRLRAYPRETVVAEKLHALLLLGETNSRMKDLYDLAVLAAEFAFDGVVLSGAVTATFERRRMPLPESTPAALLPRFYQDVARERLWAAFLERSGLGAERRDFPQLGGTLREFLEPVLDAAAGRREVRMKWARGGPWR